jgi:hypothetical protein
MGSKEVLTMNHKDKQDLELVHYRLNEMDKRIGEMSSVIEKSNAKIDDSLKFIKENLFNPQDGLWAESKLNTLFRTNTHKWRLTSGAAIIALAIKQAWETLFPS